MMTYRRTPIITGEIYHVFNRSIARQPIFIGNRDYHRVLAVIEFYRFTKPSLRFSHYNRLYLDQKIKFLSSLKTGLKEVSIFGFCLMPNHLHFLLREENDKGITHFMSDIQNSYAKYFNIKTERTGALFQSMFKAVRIETDEQLLHVLRYIHLNPLTSYVIKEEKKLDTYPWSSYIDYIGKRKNSIVNISFIKKFFPSTEHFINFTFDQLSYQRKLEKIKHLILE